VTNASGCEDAMMVPPQNAAIAQSAVPGSGLFKEIYL